MVRDRDPFGLALSQMRADLRDGRLRPGEPLITTELATRLKVSATPIREALSRLAGEGLLDDRRGRGFYALRYGAAEVEDLYRLHGAYVALALDIRAGGSAGELVRPAPDALAPDTPSDLRDRWERLWAALVHTPDGEALARAHQRVADQLAVVRLVEPLVFDSNAELREISSLAGEAAAPPLHEAVVRYHRRRQVSARVLASALRDASSIESL